MDNLENLFERVFLTHKEFYLPISWDGKDFLSFLETHFNKYSSLVQKEWDNIDYIYCEKSNSKVLKNDFLNDFQKIIFDLLKSVENYLNGFPSKAYISFCPMMDILQKYPLRIYCKNVYELFDLYNDKLNLYRVVGTKENTYKKTMVFHAPYDLRYIVSASRYSIAGFPSLYLGTSLNLCCEEIGYKKDQGKVLASRFKLERNYEANNTDIRVIELGIKPQDFFRKKNNNRQFKRCFDEVNLESNSVKIAYLLWYPLIAACSFVRTNKDKPFAAEYIIPQLLMQSVREEMAKNERIDSHKLIGIRYFSCSSVKTSEMGFDYVFPSSGKNFSEKYHYCKLLMRAFKMTKPYVINDYRSVGACVRALINDHNLTYLDDESR